jgi:hypothetical protein
MRYSSVPLLAVPMFLAGCTGCDGNKEDKVKKVATTTETDEVTADPVTVPAGGGEVASSSSSAGISKKGSNEVPPAPAQTKVAADAPKKETPAKSATAKTT